MIDELCEMAGTGNHPRLLELLSQNREKINELHSKDRNPPIVWAARTGQLLTVKFLMLQGAKVNEATSIEILKYLTYEKKWDMLNLQLRDNSDHYDFSWLLLKQLFVGYILKMNVTTTPDFSKIGLNFFFGETEMEHGCRIDSFHVAHTRRLFTDLFQQSMSLLAPLKHPFMNFQIINRDIRRIVVKKMFFSYCGLDEDLFNPLVDLIELCAKQEASVGFKDKINKLSTLALREWRHTNTYRFLGNVPLEKQVLRDLHESLNDCLLNKIPVSEMPGLLRQAVIQQISVLELKECNKRGFSNAITQAIEQWEHGLLPTASEIKMA